MVTLHILTRCTRQQNLLTIKKSVFPSPINTIWHIIFDTTTLKDIDAEMLNELQDPTTRFHFVKGDGSDYLYPQLSDIIDKLHKDVYVVILDDDNIIHPDFYNTIKSEIEANPNKDAFVYEQFVNKKDFTGLDVRKVGPEHMRLRHIDSAQYVIKQSLYTQGRYEGGYCGDGVFIENLYKQHSDKFHFIHSELCYYNYLTQAKKARVPKVLYIGGTAKLESVKHLGYEDVSLDVMNVPNDVNIESLMTSFKPDSIITVGKHFSEFPNLATQPLEVRKRWLNVEKDDTENGDIAYNVAMNQMLTASNEHLVSYFTPIYNTGNKLWNTYRSLLEQTYEDWEWVMVNDSSDGGKTLKIAEEIAKRDPRVRVYDFREKTGGIIGESKYRAACLTRGFLLAELDHDDLLTDNCTMDLINASKAYPDAGFFFNDSVEINENWESLTYDDGFAFGYGKYRKEQYRGYNWDVVITQNLNPKTIRHIVGVPNHVRAWRRDTYFAVGGHNRDLAIADDYELIVRTFLHTKICKINKIGYIQFIYNNHTGQNTHDLSRADIQRRVRTIMYHYNERIAKRFEELGKEDWAYKENPQHPLWVESRFGEDEGYVNYIYNPQQ
jgi:glycosyltransferase involved in cell wall biosynthesis